MNQAKLVEKICLSDFAKANNNSEALSKIFRNKNIEINFINSNNAQTNWIKDEKEEIAFLLTGQAVIELANKEKIELNSFEAVRIFRNTLHRVYSTSKDASWITIHFKEI